MVMCYYFVPVPNAGRLLVLNISQEINPAAKIFMPVRVASSR